MMKAVVASKHHEGVVLRSAERMLDSLRYLVLTSDTEMGKTLVTLCPTFIHTCLAKGSRRKPIV